MPYIMPFEEICMQDINLVGGKNASLGEMIQFLTPQGIQVPSGFAITTDAYSLHIKQNNLEDTIKQYLQNINRDDLQSLEKNGQLIRTLISTAPLPSQLITEIEQAYKKLESRYGQNCDVAVRSSATAEDLPTASFAGQQESFLNISGIKSLLTICPQAFASLFTNRAIAYRIDHGFENIDIKLSLGVQKMIRSDLACSGVMFTLDTESGNPDVIFITSGYGLGENIVQGSINPDEYYVHKITLTKGFKPLLKKRVGSKELKMIYTNNPEQPVTNIAVPVNEQEKFCLTDEEILTLAHQATIIEQYYSTKNNCWMPMDIEWAKDGNDNTLYIVQARPETIHSQNKKQHSLISYSFIKKPETPALLTGKSVGKKMIHGTAKIIQSALELEHVQPGDIVVTHKTDPDWEPIMKRASGIITNQGGRTCHAAIVSRELGIPAIVGTHNATTVITNNTMLTIDCSSGEEGFIYAGHQPYTMTTTAVDTLPQPPVDIMVNIGNPDEAFTIANTPNSGVGLARLEFIINTSIKIHPLALLYPDKITDQTTRATVDAITKNFSDKKDFFIHTLAQEAGTIAAAFYPKPVIIRMSDFKSNEYRELLGGSYFEPQEENPMLGFRGASRYYHPSYQEAFALECKTMHYLRSVMGMTNVILMLPFVRTVEEAKKVISLMEEHGLKRGIDGLELYMMCEIPSNVLCIDSFAPLFDGFSIGSNDLTQLTLGIDRDSALIAEIFNEQDPAVLQLLSMAIKGAQRHKKRIGICGQGPSDYPEFAQFLIKSGINSISLNPDSVVSTIIEISKKI